MSLGNCVLAEHGIVRVVFPDLNFDHAMSPGQARRMAGVFLAQNRDLCARRFSVTLHEAADSAEILAARAHRHGLHAVTGGAA